MKRKPRPVTQDDIDAFEKQYPVYKGIGRLMIREGIWILAESRSEQKRTCNGSPDLQLSRTVARTATGTLPAKQIRMSPEGACPR